MEMVASLRDSVLLLLSTRDLRPGLVNAAPSGLELVDAMLIAARKRCATQNRSHPDGVRRPNPESVPRPAVFCI